MKQVVEAFLAIGTCIATFIIFSGIVPSSKVIHIFISGALIFLLVQWVIFLISVYRKKLLIEAFMHQVSDEISRTDISSPIMITEKMKETMAQFTIEGLTSVYKEKQGSVFESESDEAEMLYKAGQTVTDFNERKFRSFLSERTVIRWCIDGLEALIGDHKSIEASWDKGSRYLSRFLDKEKRKDFPWFPSYMKLLGLPYNLYSKNFEEQAMKNMSRHTPKGYWSLFIATRFFKYRNKLRLFNLKGEEAWHEIRRFKADTLNFDDLKSTFESRRRS